MRETSLHLWSCDNLTHLSLSDVPNLTQISISCDPNCVGPSPVPPAPRADDGDDVAYCGCHIGKRESFNALDATRTLIGYWRTQEHAVAVLRQRFLFDDRDFASVAVVNAQQGPRVLSAFYPLTNRGSWHPTLDRPKDGVFRASDVRVRYEVQAANATVTPLDGGRFALTAGQRRVVLHTLPGRFAGRHVEWTCGGDGNQAFVDGICYHGAPQEFNFKSPPEIVLAVGLELLDHKDDPTLATPVLSADAVKGVSVVWDLAAEGQLEVQTKSR